MDRQNQSSSIITLYFFPQMSMAKQQSLLKTTPSTSTLTQHHSSVPVAATFRQVNLGKEELLRRGAG